mmetsp:Transcript_47887/g.133363  ORF Transcript_47887/g.133363 Transcript_47887/m.133363 type:complete len:408 (+) Transcript_47887:956-2179(+)
MSLRWPAPHRPAPPHELTLRLLPLSPALGKPRPRYQHSLGSELKKLFSLPELQRDIAHQLNEKRDYSKYLDFAKHRVARLESALGALIHAEAFVASYELEPIMHDFVPMPFSVKKLVATGLFKGAPSVPELRAVGEFSDKELCVLGALCDEPAVLLAGADAVLLGRTKKEACAPNFKRPTSVSDSPRPQLFRSAAPILTHAPICPLPTSLPSPTARPRSPIHPRPAPPATRLPRQSHEFASNEELKAAADLHCEDRAAADQEYGLIERWRTSRITSMCELFQNQETFNGDISGWDVSSVEDMNGMFDGATMFNGDLSKWDVRNVKCMINMFTFAKSFNGDISDWAVGNVETMENMFNGADSFNRNLGGEWVSSGACKEWMFANACPGKIGGLENDSAGTPANSTPRY